MGIYGLTSYVSNHKAEFLEDFKLFDCPVLIDGNSAASLIYSNLTRSNHAFGGDYDKYAHSTQDFIKLFRKCGVTPIFIFDGGYETRKLKTVLDRIKMNIVICGQYKSKYRESRTFPLLLRDTFRGILSTLDVCVVQCDFEADNELVVLSRILNCPLISYDSDFYLTDALYVPFISIDFRAVRFKKRSQQRKYYIPCQIFNVTKFLNRFGGVVDSSAVPLLSCALGNDYITPNTFKNFLGNNPHVKFEERISNIVHWLRKISSLENAVSEMVACIEKYKASMKKKIFRILADYNRTTSDLINYLPQEIVEKLICSDLATLTITDTQDKSQIEKEQINFPFCQCDSDSSLNNIDENEVLSNNVDIDVDVDDGDDDDDDIIVLEVEEYELSCSDNDVEDINETVDRTTNESCIDPNDVFDSTRIIDECERSNSSVLNSTNDYIITEKYTLNESEIELISNETSIYPVKLNGQTYPGLPEWFSVKYRRGLITSNLLNIINFRRIFIPSQSEDYFSKPSHEICLPILQIIVGIVLAEKRTISKVKCHARCKGMQLGIYDIVPVFEIHSKPLPSLKNVIDLSIETKISIFMNCLNIPENTNLKFFPDEWKLFVLILMYWKKHCKQPVINGSHIRAIMVCLIYLNVIDRKVGFTRSAVDLKRIRKERKRSINVHNDDEVEDTLPANEYELFYKERNFNSVSDYVDLISEEDCFTAANELLRYHQVNPTLLKNRKDFDLKTIHAFAQLQHCIQSISILNSVLDFPFSPCLTHLCFSGTFLYNFYSELNHRKLADGYITRTVLTKANTIIALYRYLITSWEVVISAKLHCPKFEVRKKKKAKKSEPLILDTLEKDEQSEFYNDPDNIYSMLPEE